MDDQSYDGAGRFAFVTDSPSSRRPPNMLAGLTFAVVMGLVGGFFPARRASKLPVIQALR